MRQMLERQLANSGSGGGKDGGQMPGGGRGDGNGEEEQLKFLDSAQHRALLDKWMAQTKASISSQENADNADLAELHSHQLEAMTVLKEYRPSALVLSNLQLIAALCDSNDEVLALAGVEVTKESIDTLLQEGLFAMMKEKSESLMKEKLRVTHVLAAPHVLDKGVDEAANVKSEMVEAITRYSKEQEIPLDLSETKGNGDLQ
jgi:hypothetical protein